MGWQGAVHPPPCTLQHSAPQSSTPLGPRYPTNGFMLLLRACTYVVVEAHQEGASPGTRGRGEGGHHMAGSRILCATTCSRALQCSIGVRARTMLSPTEPITDQGQASSFGCSFFAEWTIVLSQSTRRTPHAVVGVNN